MCLFPISIRPQWKERPAMLVKDSVKVGCGKCYECRQKRSREWILRLKAELQVSLTAHFITLTYDDDSAPKTRNGLYTLDKKDFQKFMKRMRKYHAQIDSKSILKYYAVGEYGSRTQRPHYHAIIFNSDPDSINRIWGKGHTHYGEVTSSSIAYVTGYTNKYRMPKKDFRHETDDRIDEFNLISNGIGKTLVSQEIQNYVNQTKQDQYIIDGEKFILPRYVKDKMLIGDDVKEEIKERKQKFFEPQNNLTREEMRNLYAQKLAKIRKNRLDNFKKQTF